MFRRITLLAALSVVAAAALAGVGTSAGNGPTASATGAGHSTFGGEQRTFTLTARKYADGSVKGELQLNNPGPGSRVPHDARLPRRERQQGVG